MKIKPSKFWGVVAALVVSTSGAWGRHPKVSPDVPESGEVRVIVQYADEETTVRPEPFSRLDGRLTAGFGRNRLALRTVRAELIDEIAEDPSVLYITPDREVAAATEFAWPALAGSILLQSGSTGKGVGVAVIDSGIFDHNDLKGTSQGNSRIVYAQNFVSGETDTKDLYGHGTAVAGVLAGNGQTSSGSGYTRTFHGYAPNVNIVSLRALGRNGTGTDSSVIAAIDRAIQLKSAYNIRVINLSAGRQVRESFTLDPLCKAVERAWKAGIVVVVAAGNNGRDNSMGTGGYATIASPANSPWVITVGAVRDSGTVTRADDVVASYSSKGPTLYDHVVKPDLVAPGNQLIVLANKDGRLFETYATTNLIPLRYYYPSSSGTTEDYFRLSGTSLAAPVVSAAAALMIEKDPSLSPDTVKARLMATASKSFPGIRFVV